MTDVELLESIFDPANKRVCSDCPCASSGSTVDDCVGTYISKEAGCCSRCARGGGYFSTKKQENKLKKKYGWDDKYGFFNNSIKECMLPREVRSETCLTYTCEYLYVAIGEDKMELVRDAWKRLFGNRLSAQ